MANTHWFTNTISKIESGVMKAKIWFRVTYTTTTTTTTTHTHRHEKLLLSNHFPLKKCHIHTNMCISPLGLFMKKDYVGFILSSSTWSTLIPYILIILPRCICHSAYNRDFLYVAPALFDRRCTCYIGIRDITQRWYTLYLTFPDMVFGALRPRVGGICFCQTGGSTFIFQGNLPEKHKSMKRKSLHYEWSVYCQKYIRRLLLYL